MTMDTTPKKRLEIVIEAPVLDRLCRRLDKLKVSGYTVMPAVSGRGKSGSWSRKGEISESQRMFVLFAVLDEKDLSPVLDEVYALVSSQIGIVTVSNVEVIRADHF
jgi:PII-like signaling protein